MPHDPAVGALLLAGAVACAGAGVVRPAGRLAHWAFAAALVCAAAGEAAGEGTARERLAAAACAVAAAGVVALVLGRSPLVGRLSWLDAAMGSSSAAAVAVAVGAGAPEAIAAGGAAGGLALSRWRPDPLVLLAAAGTAALGAGRLGAAAAAGALAVASWLRTAPPAAGPEFSRVVLTAILAFASAALVLLTAGQFRPVDDVAVVLALATVVAGMARAGLTVTERLRDSERRAVTDDLTGLSNRRHLIDRLRAAIDQALVLDRELALLLVDLDGFKELNDTLGHHAGDEVLRQIGPRLRALLRPGDTLARLGGDEFALVLMPGDEATGSAAGLRVRAALEEPFAVAGIRLHVDASVGIALFPAHARDALGLLQRADVAMYEAKRMRTGHEVYLPAGDHHSRQRLELIGELHGALQAGELVLHYQPRALLDTGAVRGVEALVRWQHPQRGLLGPAEFLPLVEQSGLTRSLTAFVLDRALEEIGALRGAGFDVGVAVNLGPADLLDLGLPAEVERLVQAHRFAPEQLELEVSEDVVMADVGRTVEVLIALRAVGVRTALDDFGAGHAALAHLAQLHVDVLKIDRSFVMRVMESERDAAIVRTLVDLGRRLGLQVVAEGVETADAWRVLAEWGCQEAQGNHLGRPMSADALFAWLRQLPEQAREPQLWAPVRS